MKHKFRLADVVVEACASIMIQNGLTWRDTKQAIKERISSLSDEERVAVENELRLMICSDQCDKDNFVIH